MSLPNGHAVQHVVCANCDWIGKRTFSNDGGFRSCPSCGGRVQRRHFLKNKRASLAREEIKLLYGEVSQ